MKAWEALHGPNLGYVLDLYERYQHDPQAVDARTRAFFDQVAARGGPAALASLARPVGGNGNSTATGAAPTGAVTPEVAARIVAAARLARSIREYGHLDAHIDPLDSGPPSDPMLRPETHGITDRDLAELPPTIVWPDAGPDSGTCLDAIRRLRAVYSGPLGYEFDHVQNFDERAWLHRVVEAGTYLQPLPPARQLALLQRLTEVEVFEQFLHSVFVRQRRFSVEGNDMLVPMLDVLVREAAQSGTREVLFGMAHRGRLNVLAHVLGKPYRAIIAQFMHAGAKDQGPSQGSPAITSGWTGDVKYHLGATRAISEDGTVQVLLTMADNPSHLEYVDPVVEGFARAAQDHRSQAGAPGQDIACALPVTIHGDAAFPGEGVVAETLNLSRLEGYETGGTIHVIVNNQIGFTTAPEQGRSTLYASDLAKGFEIPIVHVNADDPDACIAAARLAHAYRQRFHKDFLIDLVGYRRWGHNEGDEPGFTQPRLYEAINAHPTVRALVRDRLIAEGAVSREDAERMEREIRDRLQGARDEAESLQVPPLEGECPSSRVSRPDSDVSADRLRAFTEALLTLPEGFTPHPKLWRLMSRRREQIETRGGIDWAFAEILALASILADGTPVRLSGQDAERGTFSQRHLVLHDATTDAAYVPLQHLPQARASFAVYNSPLTEAAVIGFEYGYSVHAPDALVLWEAQFGDFANAGQVLIDQFLAAARAKWRQRPALGMLLPHGYEGQGPDHSSARLERYLQLAAEDNLRICNCTTASQYFHLLRLQAATLDGDRRPLVLMTPKSLLRHPAAASSLEDLTTGRFQPVMDDPRARERADDVDRVVLCSGKVAVDLVGRFKDDPDALRSVAVVRVEQLYPFPEVELQEVLDGYPRARAIVWLQEEPRNMGAWSYIASCLEAILPPDARLRYVGRPARASTAEGSSAVHAEEQARILREAAGGAAVALKA